MTSAMFIFGSLKMLPRWERMLKLWKISAMLMLRVKPMLPVLQKVQPITQPT